MNSKAEITGASVAVVSTSIAILGYLWNNGVLQSVFSFMAGAFITYVVQHRLQIESEKRKEKRENAILMRDNVYGSIFKDVSRMLENVRSGRTDWELESSLRNIMSHYLYFTAETDLKTLLPVLLERYLKYLGIRSAVEIIVRKAVRRELITSFQVDSGNPDNAVVLRVLVRENQVAYLFLMEAILQRRQPRKFVDSELKKWGMGLKVEVLISGRSSVSADLKDFEGMFERVMREAEKDALFAEELVQRERLIQEIEEFLNRLKPYVSIS